MNEKSTYGGIRSTSNFCSHRLIFTPEKIVVKPTAGNYIFFSIFIFIGLAVVGAAIAFGGELKDKIGGAVFGMVFGSAGFFGIYRNRNRQLPEIDLIRRMFYPEGKKYDSSDMSNISARQGISLNDLTALRVSSRRVRTSKSSYTAYLLDLVCRDGSECRMLSHGCRKAFFADAEKLSQALQMPIDGWELLQQQQTPKISGVMLIIFGSIWSCITGSILLKNDFLQNICSRSIQLDQEITVAAILLLFVVIGIIMVFCGVVTLLKAVKTSAKFPK